MTTAAWVVLILLVICIAKGDGADYHKEPGDQ